jgi:hypothetical protein
MILQPKVKKMNSFVRFITAKNIIGITLAPFGIYLKERYLKRKKTINHEKIHWCQQLEMLIIPFYIWYIGEWIIRIFTNPRSAYKSLSFEREANANEDNMDYLKNRKPYVWLKYMFKK